MQKEFFSINQIPAVLWGKQTEKLIIAVHGNHSNKTDLPIEYLAQAVTTKGYQILSFDLPQHGERKNKTPPCKVPFCVEDLTTVMQYAKKNWNEISLFANSIGAYFSLLAYQHENLKQAWFLSPLVDMQRMIENMMLWFHITPEQLKQKQEISTPIGETLDWTYYCFVKEHPICDWKTPTYILCGGQDTVCEPDTVSTFAKRFSCQLKLVPEAEHYFHTSGQLDIFSSWLEDTLSVDF